MNNKVIPELTTCIECNSSKKTLTEFYKHQQMTYGFLRKCKSCCRLYSVWKKMHSRCYNKSSKDYTRYGQRGIFICNSWHTYKIFSTWCHLNGWKPGLQIDRIENDLQYCPFNCQIVTRLINMRKRDATILSVEKVAQLRLLIQIGELKRKDLAHLYHVSVGTISDIKHYKSWKEVKPAKTLDNCLV